MRTKHCFSTVVWAGLLGLVLSAQGAPAELGVATITLDPAIRTKCLQVLRSAVRSDEFWPSMHAAEALTLAGQGAEVRRLLEPRLATEADGQHRCGLARELVRAGDRAKAKIMLDILAKPDPYAHVHACESLYKVNEIGDGRLMLAALKQKLNPRLALMAAAALGRWGNPDAFSLLRRQLNNEDVELAKVAAWVLARIGDSRDIPAIRRAGSRQREPIALAYFDHALATLGDAQGMKQLEANLVHDDSAVRTYAATFAGDARAVQVKDKLIALLDDDNLDTRVRAAQALLVLALPAPEVANEIVTADVYQASVPHPRYSEGSVISLRDGRLLFAITEFHRNAADSANARIVGRMSSDGGRTWEAPKVLQENVGQQNVMSVTLRRLQYPIQEDCPIGMFYLVKNSARDLRVYLRVSRDEAATFGKPIQVTYVKGYHVMNNDRVCLLRNGRLVVPVASTSDVGKSNHFVASCFFSDDRGRQWRQSRDRVDYAKRGAMEPEVIELQDGRLLMILRTQLGHIAASFSEDQGDHWSKPESWGVRTPEAPSTLRRVPSTGDLVLVWNDTYVPGAGHGGKRRPLTVAVSRDDGKTWIHKRDLEDHQNHTYSYVSATFHHGRLILTYYVRDETSGQISARFRSMPIGKLYETI